MQLFSKRDRIRIAEVGRILTRPSGRASAACGQRARPCMNVWLGAGSS